MVRAETSDHSLHARSLSTQQQMGYLVETLEKILAAWKGTGHPTSLYQRPRISVPSNRHYATCGIVHGTNLYSINKAMHDNLKASSLNALSREIVYHDGV